MFITLSVCVCEYIRACVSTCVCVSIYVRVSVCIVTHLACNVRSRAVHRLVDAWPIPTDGCRGQHA